jgi:Phytanoyl-CoA dioxygenase (PhyH)/UDP-glucoronosyl and UDP-glucosyl transferase
MKVFVLVILLLMAQTNDAHESELSLHCSPDHFVARDFAGTWCDMAATRAHDEVVVGLAFTISMRWRDDEHERGTQDVCADEHRVRIPLKLQLHSKEGEVVAVRRASIALLKSGASQRVVLNATDLLCPSQSVAQLAGVWLMKVAIVEDECARLIARSLEIRVQHASVLHARANSAQFSACVDDDNDSSQWSLAAGFGDRAFLLEQIALFWQRGYTRVFSMLPRMAERRRALAELETEDWAHGKGGSRPQQQPYVGAPGTKACAAYSNACERLARHPAVIELMQALLDSEHIVLYGMQLIVRRLGEIHDWHRDTDHFLECNRTATLWLGLENAREQTSVSLLPYSHLVGQQMRYALLQANNRGVGKLTDAENASSSSPPPLNGTRTLSSMADGNAVVWHGHLLHAGFNDARRDNDQDFFDGAMFSDEQRNKLLRDRVGVILQYGVPECVWDERFVDLVDGRVGTHTPPVILMTGNADSALPIALRSANNYVRGASGVAGGGSVRWSHYLPLDDEHRAAPYEWPGRVGSSGAMQVPMANVMQLLASCYVQEWSDNKLCETHLLNAFTEHLNFDMHFAVATFPPNACAHGPHAHWGDELMLLLNGTAYIDVVSSMDEVAVRRRYRLDSYGDMLSVPAGLFHTQCAGNTSFSLLCMKYLSSSARDSVHPAMSDVPPQHDWRHGGDSEPIKNIFHFRVFSAANNASMRDQVDHEASITAAVTRSLMFDRSSPHRILEFVLVDDRYAMCDDGDDDANNNPSSDIHVHTFDVAAVLLSGTLELRQVERRADGRYVTLPLAARVLNAPQVFFMPAGASYRLCAVNRGTDESSTLLRMHLAHRKQQQQQTTMQRDVVMEKKTLLFVAWHGVNDVNAMVALIHDVASSLVDRNIRIALAVHGDFVRQAVRACQSDCAHVYALGNPLLWPPVMERPNLNAEQYIDSTYVRHIDVLLRRMRPALLVLDNYLPWQAIERVACSSTNVPIVRIQVVPNPRFAWHDDPLLHQGISRRKSTVLSRLRAYFAWATNGFSTASKAVMRRQARMLDALDAAELHASEHCAMHRSKLILLTTPAFLIARGDLNSHSLFLDETAHFVGFHPRRDLGDAALLPSDNHDARAQSLSSSSSSSSSLWVYASLGTAVGNSSPNYHVQLIDAFLRFREHVISRSSESEATRGNFRALVSTGNVYGLCETLQQRFDSASGDVISFDCARSSEEPLRTLPSELAMIHVTSYADQYALFNGSGGIAPPSLFITHGGYGSMQQAISHAIPMLTLPVQWDQPWNAARLEDLHAGVNLGSIIDPHASHEQARLIAQEIADTMRSLLIVDEGHVALRKMVASAWQLSRDHARHIAQTPSVAEIIAAALNSSQEMSSLADFKSQLMLPHWFVVHWQHSLVDALTLLSLLIFSLSSIRWFLLSIIN